MALVLAAAVLVGAAGAFAVSAFSGPRVFTLAVESSCASCQVSIDGKVEGAPRVVRALSADAAHQVVVQGPCGERAAQEVRGKRGQSLAVSLTPKLSHLALDLALTEGTPWPLSVETPLGKLEAVETPVVVPACSEWVKLAAPGLRSLTLPRDVLAAGGPMKVSLPRQADQIRVLGGEVQATLSDGKVRTASVSTFDVDTGLVPAADYERCVEAGACPTVFAFGLKDFDSELCAHVDDKQRPRDCVDVFEARAYCAWAGKEVLTGAQWLRLQATQPSLMSDIEELGTQPLHAQPNPSRWLVAGRDDQFEIVGVLGADPKEKHMTQGTMLSVGRRPWVGFRCAQALTPAPPPRRYPGPCVVRKENESFDGFADARDVYEYEKESLARATVVHLDPGLQTQDFTHVGLPKLDDYGDRVVLRNALGQPLAARGDDGDLPPEFLSFDAAGNPKSIVHEFGPGMRLVEEYDYGCWDAPARKGLPCPRPPPGSVVAPDLGFGECFASPSGAWTLEFEDLSLERTNEQNDVREGVRGAYHYVYTPSAGEPARSEREEFSRVDIEIHDLRVLVAFDYDGDGHQELFVHNYAGASEEPSEWVEFYTFRDGKVQAYDKLPRLGLLSAVSDEDRDGRPDLWGSHPFDYGAGDHEMGCQCSGGFEAFFHSLPDGTFSADDAVVAKVLKKECKKHPGTRVLSAHDEEKAFERMNCMRLWGDSVETIRSRLDADCQRAGCDTEAYKGCCSRADFERHLKDLEDQPSLLAPAP